jgi:hypothetical protein
MRRSRREILAFSDGEKVRAKYDGQEYDAEVLSQIDVGSYQVLFHSKQGQCWSSTAKREQLQKIGGDKDDEGCGGDRAAPMIAIRPAKRARKPSASKAGNELQNRGEGIGHGFYKYKEGRRAPFVIQFGSIEPKLLAYLRAADDFSLTASQLRANVSASTADKKAKTWRENANHVHALVTNTPQPSSKAKKLTHKNGWVLGLSHALDEHNGEVAKLKCPRTHEDQPYHPADARLAAFAAAVRRLNRPVLHEIDAAFKAMPEVQERMKTAADGGVHEGAFALLEDQQVWGESHFGGRHMDGAASVLQMAIGLQGSRTLRYETVRDEGTEPPTDAGSIVEHELALGPGELYISAPCFFQHNVRYEESDFASRTIAVQFRSCIFHGRRPNLDRIMAEQIAPAVADVMSRTNFKVPSLQDVMREARELQREQGVGAPRGEGDGRQVRQ